MQKNIYKSYYVIILVFVLFSGCIFHKKLSTINYVHRFIPPGGVEFMDSVYCDKTEISNKDWLEYMYWTKIIFGMKSIKYLSVLPHHKVWNSFGIYPSSRAKSNYYLEHPRYRMYPVVGVSQIQVNSYNKWRTDRVFEYLLIKLKVIEKDPKPTRETFFTVEKYFTGKYMGLVPDTNIKYYLEYRLPSLEERKRILKFADSVDNAYFDRCHTDFCKYCKENFPVFHSDVLPRNDSVVLEPTIEVTSHFSGKSKNAIYNLRGNVAEWSAVLNIAVGGGWNDKRRDILSDEKKYNYRFDAWTGFRNICEWKKWNK